MNFTGRAKVNILELDVELKRPLLILNYPLYLDKAMLTVSETAKNKIVELRQKDGLNENHAIRVAVEGGGCSGLMYDLQFDATQQPTDHLVEDKGVKILVDRKSLLYLAGTELDFSDGLNGKGFQFRNPNATRTCGCGESFAV